MSVDMVALHCIAGPLKIQFVTFSLWEATAKGSWSNCASNGKHAEPRLRRSAETGTDWQKRETSYGKGREEICRLLKTLGRVNWSV